VTHRVHVAEQAGGRQARWDLASAVKPIDSWWTVLVVDPLAVRLLPIILRWEIVTANLVTSVALLVGAGAVTAFAFGHFLAGAILFETRFLLDCLDGKVARVRRSSSPGGAAFDQTADMLTLPACYIAIGFALSRRGDIQPSLALLTGLMCCLVAVFSLALELTRARSARDRDAWLLGSGHAVGWFRRHRLTLTPTTVEVETLGLFLAPLVLRGVWLGRAELVVAGLYGILALLSISMIGRAVSARQRG
jgi:phosphatidylglycerophosphate synthase